MLELDFSEVKAAKYGMNFLTINWYEVVQNQGKQLTTSEVYQKKKVDTLSETQKQTEKFPGDQKVQTKLKIAGYSDE